MHPRPTPEHSDRQTANAIGSGLLPHEAAKEWTAAGWSDEDAAPWWLHGFAPHQAARLKHRLEINAARAAATGTTADSADAWLGSGLSRDDITLSTTNGFLTVAEGEALAERAATDPVQRSTLRLLAALDDLGPRPETQP